METAAAIDAVYDLLREAEALDYIGEGVSQLAHALQCAWCASQAGGDDALVSAALLHDIGHLCAGPEAPSMAGLGVMEHEHLGARFLAERGFGSDVTELVAGHVAAKRYLVATRPDYAARLSEASRGTLLHQGGPMSREEIERFDAHPLRARVLALRRLDEAAKRQDREVPALDHYRTLLARELRRAHAARSR